MFGDIEIRRREPGNIVAAFAATAIFAIGKLAIVLVGMAIGAARELQATPGLVGFVTLFARNRIVQPQQREAGNGMVKTTRADFLPV